MLAIARIKMAAAAIVTATVVTGGAVGVVQRTVQGAPTVAGTTSTSLPVLVAKPMWVEKEGLALRITPAKNGFGAKDTLAFRAVWKNTSEKPFLVYGAGDFQSAGSWAMVAKNVDTKQQWPLQSNKHPEPTAGRRLEPDGEFAFDIVMDPPLFRLGEHLPPGRYEMAFTINLQRFSLPTVQKNSEWVKTSTSVPFFIQPPEDLSLKVTPAKKAFAEGEPPAFHVALRNTSKKRYLLYRAEEYYDKSRGPWKSIVVNVDTGKVWRLSYVRPDHEQKRGPIDSRRLEPGATLEFDVVMQFFFADNLLHKKLPPGRYALNMMVELKENEYATKKHDFAVGPYETPHWTGIHATAPIAFTVE
jgi:hypothetical protein